MLKIVVRTDGSNKASVQFTIDVDMAGALKTEVLDDGTTRRCCPDEVIKQHAIVEALGAFRSELLLEKVIIQ